MAAAETASGYIQHHLQNLTYGQHPVNGWGFAHSAEEAKEMGFWAFHLDTLGISVVLGLIFILLFKAAASRAFGPVTLGAAVYWSPDFFGADDQATYVEANASFSPAPKWTVSGAVGHQALDVNADYTTWNAGVAYAITDNLIADGRGLSELKQGVTLQVMGERVSGLAGVKPQDLKPAQGAASEAAFKKVPAETAIRRARKAAELAASAQANHPSLAGARVVLA